MRRQGRAARDTRETQGWEFGAGICTVLDVRLMEQLVGETLARLHDGGVTGPDVLRLLGAALYARRTGLEPGAFAVRPLRAGARGLLDSTTEGLTGVASLAQSPGPHQAVARWALEQLRVTVADLGMEKGPPPPTDEELLREVRRSLDLVTEVVERAWGPLAT